MSDAIPTAEQNALRDEASAAPASERTSPDDPPPRKEPTQAPGQAPVSDSTGIGPGRESANRSWLLPVLVGIAAVVTLVLSSLWATGLLFGPPPTESTATWIAPGTGPVATPAPTTRAKDSMVMVYVPAGAFEMGSNDGLDDEQPVHTVSLDAYWIDRTEVTNAQYRQCVRAGRCRKPACEDDDRFNGADQPVVCVSWKDAAAYCSWVGGRLPTEAEWEKAARGTDGRTYPWGDAFDGLKLNYCDANCQRDWQDVEVDDGYAYTAPVGSYPAGVSPYGVLDMAGNVWEWVSDWYDWEYYSHSPAENPLGPASGDDGMLRGGSWLSDLSDARSALRGHWCSRSYRNPPVGFRCVVTPKSS